MDAVFDDYAADTTPLTQSGSPSAAVPFVSLLFLLPVGVVPCLVYVVPVPLPVPAFSGLPSRLPFPLPVLASLAPPPPSVPVFSSVPLLSPRFVPAKFGLLVSPLLPPV